MSNLLQIVDLPEAGQAQLISITDGVTRTGPPARFQNPIDESITQAIQWHLRDYLYHPFGESRTRAEAIEGMLRNLGRLLFELVFRSSQEAQELFDAATNTGLANYQLIIVSGRPDFLAIPWELLNEPETGYLSSKLSGIARRATPQPLPSFDPDLPDDQFNVLLVSPQPLANDTTPVSILAHETLKTLASLNAEVELEYLRPPTFSALSERLSQHPGQYHLVHFDGLTLGGGGVVLLENEEAGPDPISASPIADLLVAAQVPLVLLNAGVTDSANATTSQDCAAVASSLVEAGVPLVVTLPFPLPTEARERFIQQFYPALIKGNDPITALAQARQSLMDNPRRASLAGNLLSWDWIAPIAYQAREYTPIAIKEQQTTPGVFAPPGEQLPQNQRGPELPRGGPFGLIGRRAELIQLERMLRQSPVVVLWGNAGAGKTELALGLSAWCQNTGLHPGGVFYSTFEVGAGVERIVHEIGSTVAGLDFGDLSQDDRRQWVVEYLQSQSSLLVWDGVEAAAGFPPGSPGLLGAEELDDLNRFIAEVTQGGRSSVLLTSRRAREPWLSAPAATYQLGGLNQRDRIELSVRVMETLGIEPNRLSQEYLDILDMVAGHPLAIQIALPLLKQAPAAAVLSELRKAIDQLPETAQEEGRDLFLTALMEYSFSRMSHRSRAHLPFLSLFQRRVMLDILTHITQERIYRTVLQEELGWGACRTLLRSARDAGFLEPVTPSVYQIHPAFPWFFGRKLYRQAPASGARLLEQEFVRVYSDTADYFMEQIYENQDSGATAVLAEEGNLTQALGLAMESQQWDNAQLLAQPIAQVYRMQKRFPELRRLRRQLLQEIGESAAEAESKGAAELWLYLMGTEANEATDLLELGRAEELNRTLLSYLEQQPQSESDPRVAAVYHQFGAIALHRRRLEEAEQWFQRSLAIIEKGDDRQSVADDYYSLGQVKIQQRYYTEAKEWLRKALDIHQRFEDVEEMVKDYRALGMASQFKFEYDEAESWYNRAREMLEERRDEENALLVYHELGTVCHARYQYEDAESWYHQALTLSDRLNKPRQMALEFHYLGLLAQTRGLFYDDAENWYQLALEKWEELGDSRSMGDECRQLGVLFHEQKQWNEAEQWYNRAREIFEDLQDLQRTARTYGQLGMVAEESGNIPEALEWVSRTYLLALEHNLPVMLQIKAHLARLRDKLGEAEFAEWWRGQTGGDPPVDLDVDTSAIL